MMDAERMDAKDTTAAESSKVSLAHLLLASDLHHKNRALLYSILLRTSSRRSSLSFPSLRQPANPKSSMRHGACSTRPLYPVHQLLLLALDLCSGSSTFEGRTESRKKSRWRPKGASEVVGPRSRVHSDGEHDARSSSSAIETMGRGKTSGRQPRSRRRAASAGGRARVSGARWISFVGRFRVAVLDGGRRRRVAERVTPCQGCCWRGWSSEEGEDVGQKPRVETEEGEGRWSRRMQ
jgi:hypothetical protein